MNTRLTPEAISEILNMPDEASEAILFARLHFMDGAERVSYAEKGLICHYVRKWKLHEQRLDPKDGKPMGWTCWLKTAAPWSYAACFAAMADVEELPDVPTADLAEMPASSFPILKQLSTAVRADPEVLEAAKSGDLVRHIKEHHGMQHIEQRKPLRFSLEESAHNVVEEVLAEAENHGARNRNQALELIAQTAREVWLMEAQVEAAHDEAQQEKEN